jgi:peptidoglycan/xylan/chitin deacetylase (PgdA/CDA1 family)
MPASAKSLIKRLTQYYYYFMGTRGITHSAPSLIVLMYHRILPRSDPRYYLEQPGMIVEPESFQLHLEVLRKQFHITSINKWINTPVKERPAGISCAISFDDGWSDNFTYAYPLLQKNKIHATIFLVTNLIGTKNQFWPEQLMSLLDLESKHRNLELFNTSEWEWLTGMAPEIALGNVDLSPDHFDIIINNCKSLGESQIYERLNAMASTLPLNDSTHTDILNWDQILEMKSNGLIDYGSHTQNHIRMNKAKSIAEQHSEIVGSKAIIENKLGLPINIFCYPNGDLTDESEKIVRNHYQCAVTTKPGINTTNTDPFRIKRIGMHQDESFDEISFLSRIYKLMRR